MINKVKVYVDILDDKTSKALKLKLEVNDISLLTAMSKQCLHAVLEGVEIERQSELIKKSPRINFIFIVDEIDYSIPVANQLKKPINIVAIYDKIVAHKDEHNFNERKENNKKKQPKHIRWKLDHEVVQMFDYVHHNRTKLCLSFMKRSMTLLTHWESALLASLYDKGVVMRKELEKDVFGKVSFISELPYVLRMTKKALIPYKRLVIIEDGDTVQLKYIEDLGKFRRKKRI